MPTAHALTPEHQAATDAWPPLPLNEWQDTYATLHMWTQIAGKVRLALTPRSNHWWSAALYVTPHGLTTSAIPYGPRSFDVTFDFCAHTLWIQTSDGAVRSLALYPRSVADFSREFFAILRALDIDVHINPLPQEVPNPIPFDKDTVHAAYDAAAVARCQRILISSHQALQRFRAGFIGKASPVHFFWGSFDLAASRFSGRRAPARPGADAITREAYSHEVSSVGFWPGTPGGPVAEPAYYAYMVPTPEGYAQASVRPATAYYQQQLGEFILPYDAVRNAADPAAMLLDFAQSTYAAGATLAGWDRAALER
jgi:hypothetical protein